MAQAHFTLPQLKPKTSLSSSRGFRRSLGASRGKEEENSEKMVEQKTQKFYSIYYNPSRSLTERILCLIQGIFQRRWWVRVVFHLLQPLLPRRNFDRVKENSMSRFSRPPLFSHALSPNHLPSVPYFRGCPHHRYACRNRAIT